MSVTNGGKGPQLLTQTQPQATNKLTRIALRNKIPDQGMTWFLQLKEETKFSRGYRA